MLYPLCSILYTVYKPYTPYTLYTPLYTIYTLYTLYTPIHPYTPLYTLIHPHLGLTKRTLWNTGLTTIERVFELRVEIGRADQEVEAAVLARVIAGIGGIAGIGSIGGIGVNFGKGYRASASPPPPTTTTATTTATATATTTTTATATATATATTTTTATAFKSYDPHYQSANTQHLAQQFEDCEYDLRICLSSCSQWSSEAKRRVTRLLDTMLLDPNTKV